MRDITEFEKWQIVGARMTGASVTKTAVLFDFSKAIISKTTPEFKKYGKNWKSWENRNQKPLLSIINTLKRLKWCRDHKGWSTEQCKKVLFSDEFFSFPNCRTSLCVLAAQGSLQP